MYIEKMLVNDGVSVEDKFNSLTSEQQIELLNEIQTQRDSFKESKIVAETKIKSLNDAKEKILQELKDKYKLDSIEEAEKKIAELNSEIISALNNFAEAQSV
ncbi:MAG: hypothetical protein IJF92_00430 [Bacilli bacterium]|nr:hypothetical protein [Bacilli bacterium]MBQ3307546.1 hypothetical protein [Bacilli bacterium]